MKITKKNYLKDVVTRCSKTWISDKKQTKHITSWMNVQNDPFSEYVFQNVRNLKNISNRWM